MCPLYLSLDERRGSFQISERLTLGVVFESPAM
jgi:hypothetical protein